ncbi:hypothetical protein [Paenibacillus pabuli]|uniref:hypothetical protein n=1 Tax=Paenibacillus pabuli TaxID=1472 RepID=UPI001FFFE818|nr:hypothetical protein [Paenibacillus pabuli]UPK42008.1 hypothetical protein KET34_22635 [Paenibacillus pabuli]
MDIVQQLKLLQQIYSEKMLWDEELQASRHVVPKSISSQDLEGLKMAGHLPNQFVKPQHDETVSELKTLADRWTLQETAQCFVASMWSAPMIWRSLLTGKLIASSMPDHELTPYPSMNTCQVCGLSADEGVDTSLQWYWRMTNGTPLDGDILGHVLALRELSESQELPVPNAYDRWTFRAVLTVLRNLPPNTRYSKAAELLKKERLLPAKKIYVYRDLLETLALIGILDTPEHPGMITSFTSYVNRDQRPNVRVEVQAPLAWWNSSVGVNEKNLIKIFGDYDCSDVSLEERPEPNPSLKETIVGAFESRKVVYAKAPKKSPDAGIGEVQPGDVYAVRVREGAWITVYCHEVKDKRAIVEYLDGVFAEMPGKADLVLTVRPRPDERWQCSAIAIDSTSWVRRVAREMPAPASSQPEPDRIPFHNAKDLKHMASWCFPDL